MNIYIIKLSLFLFENHSDYIFDDKLYKIALNIIFK